MVHIAGWLSQGISICRLANVSWASQAPQPPDCARLQQAICRGQLWLDRARSFKSTCNVRLTAATVCLILHAAVQAYASATCASSSTNPMTAGRTRMPQEPQQLDLPQDSGRVGDVVEHVVDLLDRHLLARLGVDRRADDAVGALADDLLDSVPVGLAVFREELQQAACGSPRLPSRDLMLIVVLHFA